MEIDRTIEFILTSQANSAVQIEELRAAQRRTEETLRRAIRLAVREARNERQKRQEMDARLDSKISQLADTLQAYFRSLKPGGNGEHPDHE
jgi:hypothetical protein